MARRSKRPQVRRPAIAGIGTTVLLVGIASPATAASGVVIPLEPTGLEPAAFPVENFVGSLDPMADPNVAPGVAPVGVRYSGTIAVDLPDELDDSAVGAGFAVRRRRRRHPGGDLLLVPGAHRPRLPDRVRSGHRRDGGRASTENLVVFAES